MREARVLDDLLGAAVSDESETVVVCERSDGVVGAVCVIRTVPAA